MRQTRQDREGRSSPKSRVFARVLVPLLALTLAGTARAQAPGAPPGAPAPGAEPAEPPLDELSPAQRFRRAENLFEFGDCEGAMPVLEGLAFPGTLGDEKQLIEVHRMLGVCLFLEGHEEKAVRQFEQLLYIDPDYALDSFRNPPPVVELFDRVKAAIKEKQELIERAKRDSDPGQGEGKTVLIERERVVKETPFATVFLPFGLAQWANDEPVKAGLLGGAQALTLGLNLASYWTMQGLKWDGATTPGEVALHNAAQVTQVAALVSFLGLYLYGVGDAWWNHLDRAEVENQETRRELTPEEAKKALRRLDQDVE